MSKITSRQLVYDTLEFKHAGRVPREVQAVPWAFYNYPDEINGIMRTFPNDMVGLLAICKEPSPVEKGDMCEVGEYVDMWGCRFTNLIRGIIGEVKDPLVKDDEWDDVDNVHIPYDKLSFDIGEVNETCAKLADKFTYMGTPRPFEQLQFIRGTENLYMDLIYRPQKMFEFIEKMHAFYCEYVEKIAKTDVDAIVYMDDWGSQNSLLINPATWREIFKPMYRDYINIAKKHGKKIFMHSDGYILDIIPDLIDMGVDAINCQIFCMGVDKLKQFKGKITFWGEIDRQQILPFGTVEDVKKAVRSVYENLYQNGGCIAECDFEPAGKPENVYAVYDEWNKISENPKQQSK